MVQLVSFPGCPHVEGARRALRAAFATLGREPRFEEVDTSDPNTPAALRIWGSPTILVDGMDVTGGEPTGPSCRLYPGGAPSVESIVAALRQRRAKK
jgi:hypothetical protein